MMADQMPHSSHFGGIAMAELHEINKILQEAYQLAKAGYWDAVLDLLEQAMAMCGD